MFIKAWFISVTGSNSSSALGGMSIKASLAAEKFLIVYSIAPFKLKDSIKAVSFSAWVFPTDFTSIPSALLPTPSSGCSLTPLSMISAMNLREGANYFNLYEHKAIL